MSVKQEIKSQLAKLLATEDLVVEHRSVTTAHFNVDTRVLTLPIWEKASNDVYDMLVGHEVGHALYTPDVDWWLDYDINPSFVNIVEDVRIEKLIKRRYAGLAKTFYKGYNELSNEDFFEIDGKDLSTFNLADRINLYFKIGSWVDISFSVPEKEIISLINKCETFEDVLNAAEVLYNYCKVEKEKEHERNKEEKPKEDPADLDTPSYIQGEDESIEEDIESEEFETSSEDSMGNEPNDNPSDEIEVETVKALQESLKNLVNEDSRENIYIEKPNLNLDKVIISNKTVHEICDEQWVEDVKMPVFTDKGDDLFYRFQCPKVISEVDDEYVKFKKSAKKEVNYLVKEFECRKAADNYSRATTSRTGILSTEKLHTYRFNEDLFKKVTTIPDGKNHGLVFILDWSGSMNIVMEDTIKQLYNLIWFCRKVQIPFEVYAFTNDYPKEDMKCAYEPKENLFEVNGFFSLLNLFTHKVNGKILDQQMKNIFRLAYNFGHRTTYKIPIGLGLSGTPLNETLISLHQLLPKFKKENKVDKVQCVILTDGEAGHLGYHRIVNRPWEEEPFLGTRQVHSDCFLRDRKLGKTYRVRYEYYSFTEMLLRNLRDHFFDMNFIGIRVISKGDANSFIRRYYGWSSKEYEKIVKRWRKDKSFSIDNSGYHKYFGLSSNSLSNDNEFEVEEDATKTQIKRAFVKSLKNKKMNKKILSEFVELIA